MIISALLFLIPFASNATPTSLAQKLTEFHFVDALEPRTRAALFLVRAPAARASDLILDTWVKAAGRTTLRFDITAMIRKNSDGKWPEHLDPVGYAVRELAETIASNLQDRPSNLTIGIVASKDSFKKNDYVLTRALYEWLSERSLSVGSRLYSLDRTNFFIFVDDMADETEFPQAFLSRMTFRTRVTNCQLDLAGLTKEALQLPEVSFTQGHASRQPKPH